MWQNSNFKPVTEEQQIDMESQNELAVSKWKISIEIDAMSGYRNRTNDRSNANYLISMGWTLGAMNAFTLM